MPTGRPRAPRLKQPRPGEEETTTERTIRRQELQRARRVVSDVRAKKKSTRKRLLSANPPHLVSDASECQSQKKKEVH